jgi:murein L,D-transpeptidase YcbB/YkuD
MNIVDRRSLRAAGLPVAFAVLLVCGPATGAPAINAIQSTPSVQARSISVEAMRSAVSNPATRQFYNNNGWMPVWNDAAVQSFDQMLSARSAHGLDRVDFAAALDGSLKPAAREVAITATALRFAAALARGFVDAARLHPVCTLPRPQLDLARALASAGALERRRWLDRDPPESRIDVNVAAARLSFHRGGQLADNAGLSPASRGGRRRC